MLCKQDRQPADKLPEAKTIAHGISSEESDANWYVAYTKPRQELVAEVNLKQQNFETYLPLFKVAKTQNVRTSDDKHGQDGEDTSLHSSSTIAYEPMFPRYLFFKPVSGKQSVAAARSSRGVSSLVAFGSELAAVPAQVLDTIRKLEAQRNDADLLSISPVQPGRRARLRNNALKGIEGVVQAVGAKRILLLMDFLGQQKTLKVKHGQIELV